MDDLKENNSGTEIEKVTRLPLTSDYVFKRIFAREENNSMLKDFLEAILNIHINKVEVKNPDCNTKLEQWLWLIDGSEEEKVKMSAKENEEINKTVEELNKLSKNPDEVAKYEEREWSIMRYNVEMETNRKIGEKEGEARGRKEGEGLGRVEGEKAGRENEKRNVIKNLHKLNIPIEQIAQAVELTEKEIEEILKVQEN